jgi:hypothetical protein
MLKTTAEWREWCRNGSRPKDIPSNPNLSYQGKGWISFGDWLGTGRRPRAKIKELEK